MNKIKLSLIPYLLSILFVGIPLFLMPFDTWDGVRISISANTNKRYFVDNWLLEASMQEQVWFIRVLDQLSNLIHLDFLIVNKIATCCFLLLLIYETLKFARDVLQLNDFWVTFSGILVSVFPAYSLLVSSVLTYYIAALALTFTLSRLYVCSQNYLLKIIIFFFFFIVFGYGSMFLLSIAVVMGYFYSTLKTSKNRHYKVNVSFIVFISFVSLNWAYRALVDKPWGVFLDYNKIQIPKSFSDLKLLAAHLEMYSTLLFIPGLLISVLIGISFVLRRGLVSSIEGNALERFLPLGILFAGIVPYIAVGKATSFFWLNLYSGRHAFAAIPGIALLAASLGNYLTKSNFHSKTKIDLYVVTASIFITSLVPLGMMLNDFWYKAQDQLQIESIVSALRNSSTPAPGIVQIVLKDKAQYLMHELDAPYISYLAYGKTHYYTTISSLDQLVRVDTIPQSLLDGSWKYPYRANSSYTCRTYIELQKTYNLNTKLGPLYQKGRYAVSKYQKQCD